MSYKNWTTEQTAHLVDFLIKNPHFQEPSPSLYYSPLVTPEFNFSIKALKDKVLRLKASYMKAEEMTIKYPNNIAGIYKKCPFYDQLRIVFSRPNINLNTCTSPKTTIKTPHTKHKRAVEYPQTSNNNSDNKLLHAKPWTEEETPQTSNNISDNKFLHVKHWIKEETPGTSNNTSDNKLLHVKHWIKEETPGTSNNNSDNKLPHAKHWSEEETLQLIDFLTENPRLELPSAEEYYSPLINRGIAPNVPEIRRRVWGLKAQYFKAKKYRTENEGKVDNLMESTRAIFPYYDKMHSIIFMMGAVPKTNNLNLWVRDGDLKNDNYRLWSKEEISILIDYLICNPELEGRTLVEYYYPLISPRFNFSVKSIRDKISRLKLKYIKAERLKKKDPNMFEARVEKICPFYSKLGLAFSRLDFQIPIQGIIAYRSKKCNSWKTKDVYKLIKYLINTPGFELPTVKTYYDGLIASGLEKTHSEIIFQVHKLITTYERAEKQRILKVTDNNARTCAFYNELHLVFSRDEFKNKMPRLWNIKNASVSSDFKTDLNKIIGLEQIYKPISTCTEELPNDFSENTLKHDHEQLPSVSTVLSPEELGIQIKTEPLESIEDINVESIFLMDVKEEVLEQADNLSENVTNSIAREESEALDKESPMLNPLKRDLKKGCRSCLVEIDSSLVLKTTICNGEMLLTDAFSEMTGIAIKEDDKLTNKFCVLCTEKMEEFFEFKKQAQISQEILEKHVKEEEEALNQKNDDEMIIEEFLDSISDNDNESLKKKEETEKPKTICSNCGIDCESVDLLLDHNINGCVSKLYLCNFCGKLVKQIDHHLKCHTEERPYVCKVCGGAFKRGYELTKHSVLHREKQHECKDCGLKFAIKFRLKLHSRVHSDDRPFTCKICEQGYISKSSLERHIKYDHQGFRHSCHLCSKTFANLCNFRTHLTIHNKTPRLKCCECNKDFYRTLSLKTHATRYHPDKLAIILEKKWKSKDKKLDIKPLKKYDQQ